MIQAKVRSTTQRRLMTTKPSAHGMRRMISSTRLVLSLAQRTSFPAYPPPLPGRRMLAFVERAQRSARRRGRGCASAAAGFWRRPGPAHQRHAHRPATAVRQCQSGCGACRPSAAGCQAWRRGSICPGGIPFSNPLLAGKQARKLS